MTELEQRAGTTTAPTTTEELAAARPWYTAELAQGVERFLEPHRRTCPWCGSGRLRVRVTTPDVVQGKPGVFTLEECRTCRHVFQNPRLTPAGLDFYYRDCYDGLGGPAAEQVFSWGTEFYLNRARMVAPFLTPRTWLDVGTGYGHFCKDARTVWPDATFDGLDMGAGVELGLERGWLDHAYRGWLADLADQVAGRYDVVSMHHYLEHVRDPRAELDVVADIVGTGSYLLIEVPDPSSMLGRILGRWWAPWGQPQHQHLIPTHNLLQALVERGFTPVSVARPTAHMSVDLTYAVMSFATVAGPDPRLPWRGTPTALGTRRWEAVWKAAPRVIKAAYRADQAIASTVRRADAANSYRILARKGP
jgi:hypothetical protein